MDINNHSIDRDINEQLKQIEVEHQVKILLAIESGSRAWGFPSQDSDYDVRFLYCHEPDWYLSIFNKKDVIELPIDGLLDINGWDIQKALALLKQSNPALMEWIASPIEYQDVSEFKDSISQLAKAAFLPLSSCHHYLSMAKTHLGKNSQSKQVKIKKYLYSLRPILCCRWVIEKGNQPPMLFTDLLDVFLPDGHLRAEIDELLVIKKNSDEKDQINRSQRIEIFVEDEVKRLFQLLPDKQMKLNNEHFENLFRKIIGEVYG